MASYGYNLSSKALEDLDEIWRYTAQKWSLDQADNYFDGLIKSFEMIAVTPAIARERDEFNPPVRIHFHDSHLIVYNLINNRVIILRILSHQQNWQKILHDIDYIGD